MSRDSVSAVGAALIVSNWLLAIAVFVEYVAVQELLRSANPNWQDSYDSGAMAFASLPVLLCLLATTAVMLVALSAVAIRRAHPTLIGWIPVVGQLALLVAIWNGPGAPGSPMDYWVHVALLTGSAATGIVAGANLRQVRGGAPSRQLNMPNSTPGVSQASP